MTVTTTVAAPVDFRGLVLAAHYAFRKETPARSGEAKGLSTAASQRYRVTQDPEDFQDVVYNVKLLGRIGALMDLVGEPSEVPDKGLTQFLLGKQNVLYQAYDGSYIDMYAAINQSSRIASDLETTFDAGEVAMNEIAGHQALVDAGLHVLQSFSKHFGPVIRQLKGN